MFKKENGFTLLEIISILIILGILAAVAVSRSVNFNAEVFSGADALKAHLRYAQTLAMNSYVDYFDPGTGASSSLPSGIGCNGTSYWLFKDTNIANTANWRLPEDEQYINADNTINLASKKISVGAFTIFFDKRGIPYTAYTSETVNTPLTIPLVIAVTAGGTTSNVTVTPLTGYIP